MRFTLDTIHRAENQIIFSVLILPVFYLRIFSLPILYSLYAYFDSIFRELSMLSCCYNKVRQPLTIETTVNLNILDVFPTTHVVKRGRVHLIFSGALKTIMAFAKYFPHQSLEIRKLFANIFPCPIIVLYGIFSRLYSFIIVTSNG